MKTVEDVLKGIEDVDAYELGKRLNFTMAEYQEIGRQFGRHPSTIAPCDRTREQVEAYLLGIKNSPEKKKAKADAEKARRLRKKEERAQEPPIDDLDTRRCKKIVAHAKQYPEKHHTTGDLVRGLRSKKDFKSLTDKTCRNCIDKLLNLAQPGSCPCSPITSRLPECRLRTAGPHSRSSTKKFGIEHLGLHGRYQRRRFRYSGPISPRMASAAVKSEWKAK
jgi:hypothetical protein